ncbi:hypothetical protein [Kitasatospora sp. NPDC127116]|uniref:hypothetical protein n=1 Tax=Kitasatospora sp. NPDC127116 TaxID=3345367 RepID=UPI00362D369D
MIRPYAGPWDRESVVRGELCPTCGGRIVLTREQRDVLVLTAAGRTIPAVALRMGCSTGVVCYELKRLRSITGARNAAHLAAIGVRAGIVPAVGPDRPPGRLDSTQVRVFAHISAGLMPREIAEITGRGPAVVRDAVREVGELLGVQRIPAMITMLFGLGELPRRHHGCSRPACVLSRQQQELATGPRQEAREAAARWAEDVAAAAVWRTEHRRARQELADALARLDDGMTELRAARFEAQEALDLVAALTAETLADARGSTSQLPPDLADMRARAMANLTDLGVVLRSAQVVNDRLAAVEKRQDRLEQSQSRLAAGFERQAELAARHRAHALVATTTPELRAERPLVPPEARPWNSPRPPTTL